MNFLTVQWVGGSTLLVGSLFFVWGCRIFWTKWINSPLVQKTDQGTFYACLGAGFLFFIACFGGAFTGGGDSLFHVAGMIISLAFSGTTYLFYKKKVEGSKVESQVPVEEEVPEQEGLQEEGQEIVAEEVPQE
ncbi:hypothetical protein MHLP_04460 [Candidatus Mycoplasma haematolamae str. Purdue]|uniref:Transmembrane protein n=1 Tax=Mycoplasma haematolamae (strain Purdue) TaxID=1212765 RepID=I7C7G2_MYCHA|nr:hypothetical protein [Candidatus Mycoplasma haematolamae]AFO52472.1 hypothetical protein MHLP_04460 [Candidatus Mycoplasma haematolamae str. Purdue]